MKKIILKIKGMHCVSCAMNIDGELEDTEGIEEASTNYARHEAIITFDNSKIDEEKIIKIIRRSGYDVFWEKQ